ncbi:SDR family oxidoreductase [Ruegeria jejuensis]|uniref:SDR family oxidoreductase n=1 Tax=Ruegeria jejuensis TaxID=3233338 RepID=UPI00355C13C1
MELEAKTLIITGASSGIGAAAARLFAAEGATLVLGARRGAELQQVADEITESGGKAVCLAGDVADEAYAKALVALAQSEFGGLDGAFNNAGMMGDMAPVPEMALANWRAVIDTNLTSALLAAQAQIPALREAGGGSLVFTGSFVGISNGGLPGMGAYAASKAGLAGLVRSLAADHAAEGIRVSALLPGGTKTAMAGDDPEAHAFISGLHPVKRMAAPREIAQAAMFLLSDRASFVTGGAMAVDGGMAVRLL